MPTLLDTHLKAEKIPYKTEVRFAPPRRWRFDYVIGEKLAIEVDGAVYSGGRHVRGKGYEGDLEKFNEAVILGYRVLRFSTGQVKSGLAIDTIKRLIGGVG
jgi:very-short-patch-repair endonuclease